MFRSSQSSQSDSGNSEVNMTPLIDMVFILLIFFLVTAHFKPDEGIELDRQQAYTGAALPADTLRVAIAANGDLYLDGRTIDLANLRRQIREQLAGGSEASVTLAPDARTPSGRLIEVLDAVKLEGVEDVAVVTRPAP